MKKVLILGVLLFALSGCSSDGEEFNCTIDGKEATFMMKDGMITSYTIDGKEASTSEVDELNGTYFTSATNNEEGKLALDNYVQSEGGSCR